MWCDTILSMRLNANYWISPNFCPRPTSWLFRSHERVLSPFFRNTRAFDRFRISSDPVHNHFNGSIFVFLEGKTTIPKNLFCQHLVGQRKMNNVHGFYFCINFWFFYFYFAAHISTRFDQLSTSEFHHSGKFLQQIEVISIRAHIILATRRVGRIIIIIIKKNCTLIN